MAKKDMMIKIMPDQVMYTNISKSKDGYNSARMVVKTGEKEYMAISYEWEGDGVPDFAINLMQFMQANELEVGKEYEENAKKKCGGGGKKNKSTEDAVAQTKTKEKICPECKKPMSECTCEEDDMEDD